MKVSHHLKMSPGVLAAKPTFVVAPMEKTMKEKHNFGAVITDLDLNNISGRFAKYDFLSIY